MYKINLHAHSLYSDGHHSIEDNALVCRMLGFSACVLTDHVYVPRMDSISITLTPEKFERQLVEAEEVSQKLGYPVIIGAEVGFMRMEECCVFGRDAIRELIVMKKEQQVIPLSEVVRIKETHDCAINLNHPMKAREFVEEGCMAFLDGYEAYNSGSYFFDRTFTVPEAFESIVALSNSDAHDMSLLGVGYNLTEDEIVGEQQLINYIKGHGHFEPFIDPEWVHEWQRMNKSGELASAILERLTLSDRKNAATR